MLRQEIELRNVIAILRRQMRIIGYTFSLVFGLAAVFFLSAAPKYTAMGLILVDPGTKNLLEPAKSYPASAGTENARVDSEVEILRSSAVGLAVIVRENLIADPEFGPRITLSEKLGRSIGIAHAAPVSRDQMISKTLSRFKDAVTIRRKGLTYLISVSVSSQSPHRSAELANAVAKTYIDQQVQSKISASLAARDVLRGQIEAARLALEGSERAFDTFVAQNISRIDTYSDNLDITGLNAKLLNAEMALEIKHQINTDVKDFLQNQSWEELAHRLGDLALLEIEKERRELVQKLHGYGADSTLYSDLAKQITTLETELDRTSAKAVSHLNSDIRNLKGTTSDLRAQIRQAVLVTDLPPDFLTEIYAIQQDASITRNQYQNLLSSLRAIETQSRIQMADSQLVSPALAPNMASFPNKNLVLLVALAASIGLGVSMAFLKEYYIGGITSPIQLSELLQMPSVNTIPMTIERNEQRLSIAEHVIDAPLSTYAESIRNLQASVDQAFRFPKNKPAPTAGKIVLVTSSLPAEGKTTTSLALARTYALAGKSSLLIDADLRLPSIHRHLGFEPKVGILDYLRNPADVNISNAFYARDPASPLALMMGAGRSDIPTDQLLNSATFEALLHQARDVYDVIIVDSPPVLPVVDARYIAHHADAVVMMVKWAATSQNDVRAAVDTLRAAMQSNAAFLPVLGQQETRGKASRHGGYYSGYSAAI